MSKKTSARKRTHGSIQPAGSNVGVESEVCEYCEGVGSISYNPNLNPNAFPATATTKCRHCDGTGRLGKSNPQPNDPDQRPGRQPKA